MGRFPWDSQRNDIPMDKPADHPKRIYTVLKIFSPFTIFEQLALALKTEFALEFLTVLNMYFLSFRIIEQLALALKTEFALKFFKPEGAAPPDPPPRTPMAGVLNISVPLCRNEYNQVSKKITT